jgi:hypothetical protein
MRLDLGKGRVALHRGRACCRRGAVRSEEEGEHVGVFGGGEQPGELKSIWLVTTCG